MDSDQDQDDKLFKARQKLRKGAKNSHINKVLDGMMETFKLNELFKKTANRKNRKKITQGRYNPAMALKLRIILMKIMDQGKSRQCAADEIMHQLRINSEQINNKKFFKANQKNTIQFKNLLFQKSDLTLNAIEDMLKASPENYRQMEKAVTLMFQGRLDPNQRKSIRTMTQILCLPRSQVQDYVEQDQGQKRQHRPEDMSPLPMNARISERYEQISYNRSERQAYLQEPKSWQNNGCNHY